METKQTETWERQIAHPTLSLLKMTEEVGMKAIHYIALVISHRQESVTVSSRTPEEFWSNFSFKILFTICLQMASILDKLIIDF